MNNPKISVIVTYTNCEAKIKACIESILNQNFKDFELICVNNASIDASEDVVLELTKNCENVKRISLASCVDDDSAKNSAMTIASGDFVCFVDANNTYEDNFLGGLILNNFSVKNESINVINGELYRRDFLENNKVLNKIIENNISTISKSLELEFENYKKLLKEELDNNSKSNIENVNNKNYELWNRFAQLEKTVFEKDANFWSAIENSANNLKQEKDVLSAQLYDEISKIYENINEQINCKSTEISQVYEEISKNYSYTESLISQAKDELHKHQSEREDVLGKRIYALEKEIIVRYVNIKRLLDLQIDEVNAKLNGDYSQNSVDVPKVVSENIDKLYSQLNKTNAQLYEELTRIYQDLNEKLINKMNEQQCQFDQKINELSQRIQALEEKTGY